MWPLDGFIHWWFEYLNVLLEGEIWLEVGHWGLEGVSPSLDLPFALSFPTAIKWENFLHQDFLQYLPCLSASSLLTIFGLKTMSLNKPFFFNLWVSGTAFSDRKVTEIRTIKNRRLENGLDLCCTTKLSGMMEMFYPVLHGGQEPCVTTKYLKCDWCDW